MPSRRGQPLNIVILGASHIGLAVAHKILDTAIPQLGTFEGAPTYHVIVVSPSTHVYRSKGAPEFLSSPSLMRTEDIFTSIDDQLVSFGPIAGGGKVRFFHGRATEIDTSARKVMISYVHSLEEKHKGKGQPIKKEKTSIRYHALIIATGTSSQSPLFSLCGPHEDTVAELDTMKKKIETAQSVVIVGGSPLGVELAGRLATHYNHLSHQLKTLCRKVRKRAHETGVTDAAWFAEIIPDRRCYHFTSEVVEGLMACCGLLSRPWPPNSEVKEQGKRGSSEASSTSTSSFHRSISSSVAAYREQHIARYYGSEPKRVITAKRITLLSGSNCLLPHAPLSLSLSRAVEKHLRHLGIHIIHNLREVSHTLNPSDGRTTVHLTNATRVTADIYIDATGSSPNTKFLPLAMLNKNGYVKTDTTLRSSRARRQNMGERIYAIGTCTSSFSPSLRESSSAIAVLVHNLTNDLLEHEIRMRTVRTATIAAPRARALRPLSLRACSLGEGEEPKLHVWLAHEEKQKIPLSPIAEDGTSFTSSFEKRHATSHSMRAKARSRSTCRSVSRERPPMMDFGVDTHQETGSQDVLLPGGKERVVYTPAQAAEKIGKLKDVHYIAREKTTCLIPMSRSGGVGAVKGVRVPGWTVPLLAGLADP
jgi:NADH dehydrogenase FAD-containing subunit